MPSERAPTPLSQTAVSVGESSEDRNSDRSDSVATVEIFRSDGQSELATQTPSENTENAGDGENVTRYRAHNGDSCKNFTPTEVLEIPSERKKSNGISKGVILNAMNFGSYDLKFNAKDKEEKSIPSKDNELRENASGTPKALEASSESDGKTEEGEKSEEKKKMSLSRKIAFGFSFLPSVMFVLTFAVILPCEEYKLPGKCVQTQWSLFLNQTEITSDLRSSQTLLLGYKFENTTVSSNGLMNVDDETSKEIWKTSFDSSPKFLECGKVDVNQDGVKDCFAIMENGNVCALNLTDGYVFWTFSTNQPPHAAVLLSLCRYKDLKPIAVASHTKGNALVIDVLSETDGSLLASKQVRLVDDCTESGFSMKSWSHNNEIDLVFSCVDTQGSVYIWRVKQNLWCPPETGDSIIIPQQLIKFDSNRTGFVYHSTKEGILIWAGNEVTFLDSDGSEKWRSSTDYHPQTRVVKFGNFYIGGEQVALIGTNTSSNAEDTVVSVLTSEDGTELITLTVTDRIVNQVVVLNKNETDALLLSLMKVTESEETSTDKEVILRSNFNSSQNFRTDAPYKVTQRSVVEELVLLQFEGKNTTHVVLHNEIPITCITAQGGVCEHEYRTSHIISAYFEEEDDSLNLKIIMLKPTGDKLSHGGSQFSSQLTALDITSEIPGSGEPSCTL